ncbi:SRPBCC domain-containing protein [Flavobacteriaceae bacterium F89]|uniref:SRPBCC domain-containing protein n=1 Tax=Cerina litoralis TaxID=2874477 RepID=A0AAE3EXI5_9FLAO|nr:SRPBCC domain-containing protein [Cerina litoralis]MCG2462728.1 SRPBCC domain-containing protein [Cerina litoralis]
MKAYHTNIKIRKPIDEVWRVLTDFKSYPNWNPLVGKLTGEVKEGGTIKTHIIPLGKAYYPKILSYKKEEEIIWQGAQGAKFLLSGKHYYKLQPLDNKNTELFHGEYFTGILSYFLPKSLLQKMENTFVEHNEALKKRLENEG